MTASLSYRHVGHACLRSVTTWYDMASSRIGSRIFSGSARSMCVHGMEYAHLQRAHDLRELALPNRPQQEATRCTWKDTRVAAAVPPQSQTSHSQKRNSIKSDRQEETTTLQTPAVGSRRHAAISISRFAGGVHGWRRLQLDMMMMQPLAQKLMHAKNAPKRRFGAFVGAFVRVAQ